MAIAPFGASLLVRELRCWDDGFETLPEHALSRFFSAQSSAPVSAGNGCLLVEGGKDGHCDTWRQSMSGRIFIVGLMG